MFITIEPKEMKQWSVKCDWLTDCQQREKENKKANQWLNTDWFQISFSVSKQKTNMRKDRKIDELANSFVFHYECNYSSLYFNLQ